MSLRQLAKRSGIHFTKLWAFEHGLEMRGVDLARLAAALGISVDELFSEHA